MDTFTKITGSKIKFMNWRLKNTSMTLGWPYLAAWAHRISGVLLIFYVWFHIITLSSLHNPERFDSQIKVFGLFFFVILEWFLAVPVIYHSLNGGRIVLYEIFENRKDQILLKWVIGLSILYLFMLALIMTIGNQTVSDLFFWGYVATSSACLSYITILKIKFSGASIFWKLQRISGSFLLLMVPAHMLFMHLNPALGHDAQTIITRMDHLFIKLVDFALVICVLYHGAYGLYAIGGDYLKSQREKIGVVVLIVSGSLLFAWIGVKLIVLI